MSIKHLIQSHQHTDFPQFMSWNLDPAANMFRPNGMEFDDSNASYDFGNGFAIQLDTVGRRLSLHQASRDDIDLNFWTDDALLLAMNKDDVANPTHAAIRIELPHGVRGVGAFVSGFALGIPTSREQTPFVAQMWLRLSGSPNYSLPMVKAGINGRTLPGNSPPTAPFVGARTTGNAEIAEACFDVSLFGNQRFTHIAISDLWMLRS